MTEDLSESLPGEDTGPAPAFIIDDPAVVDRLQSHAPLAGALARVVLDGKARAIGVLGDWGSGKSTVMRLLQSRLMDQAPDRVACLPFDAWQHQSDPQRRVLLEALVDAVAAEALVPDCKAKVKAWRKQIARLNRQREYTKTKTRSRLNPRAVVFAAALLLLPLGIRLIGDGTLAAGDQGDLAAQLVFWGGWALTLGPLLVGAVILKWPGKSLGGTGAWALLANRAPERRSELKIKDPEPSAIDFQRLFREITTAVQSDGRRLLVIVDNLDRLPADEALLVWSTVRSIFLGADGGRSDGVGSPTVIMPLDPTAIQKLYRGGDGKEDPATVRSFIEKTFDIVFHVPKPVLSRRHAFLRDQLSAVLGDRLATAYGDRADAVIHAVGSVFEAHLADTRDTPSPRAINSFVNALAVLEMQRRAEPISLPVIAAFVLKRELIDPASPRQWVIDNQVYLSTLGPDWRDGLAALYYGVSLDLGRELFIDEPLRDTIYRRDSEEFEAFARFDGFDRFLLNNLDGAMRGDFDLAPFALAELLARAPRSGPWVPVAWGKLRDLALQTPGRSPFTKEDAVGLRDLIDATAPEDRGRLITQLAEAFGGAQASVSDAGAAETFAEIAEVLSTAAQAARLKNFEVPVPGGFEGFFLMMAQPTSVAFKRMLRPPSPNPDDLAAQLAGRISGPHVLPGTLQAVVSGLCDRGPDLDWSPLITQLRELAASQNLPLVKDAFDVSFDLIARSHEARLAMAQILGDGHFSVGFRTVWDEGDRTTLSRAVAVMVFLDAALQVTANQWKAKLDTSFDLVSELDAALQEILGEGWLDWLKARHRRHPGDRPLLARLLEKRLEEPDFDWEPVFRDVTSVLKILPETTAGFWTHASRSDAFERFLGRADIQTVETILDHLAEQPNPPRLDRWTRAAIAERPAEEWRDALDTGEGLFPLVRLLDRTISESTPLGLGAYQALQDQFDAMISTDDAAFRARWFAIEAGLGAGRRSALRRRLARAVLTINLGADQLVDLLDHAGPGVIQSTYLSDRADQAVKHIVLPLSETEPGRQWLIRHAEILRPWDAQARAETRDALRHQLARHAITLPSAQTVIDWLGPREA